MILLDTNQTMIATLFSLYGKFDTDKITENDVRRATLSGIYRFKNMFKHKYGDIVLCYDTGNYWRKDFFPQYKQNRRKKQDADSTDWSKIFAAFKTVRSEIKSIFPYKSMYVNGVEADDIISVISENFYNKEDVLIVSSDKDFKQLQKFPNVYQYSPNSKKMMECENPQEFLVDHIIRGDSSDGIPNILSDDDAIVNPDKKQKIMNAKRYGTVMEDFTKGVIGTDSSSFFRNYNRNKMLIDLSEIPNEIKTKILDQWSEPIIGDSSKVFNYMVNNKLGNLLGELG